MQGINLRGCIKSFISYLLTAIRASKGGSQLTTHSQCASRITITSPTDFSAPITRACTKPSRLSVR